MAELDYGISVIIPAYNEEAFIGRTIQSIQQDVEIEILVVDHESSDKTAEIASCLGARVLSKSGGTIAAVRNFGARESRGDILVFLDADVWVSPEWHRNLSAVASELRRNHALVTGSRCLAPQRSGLFNRFWFSRLGQYGSTYVNSGHLVTSRALFDRVGGFTENLETAEDYDFCVKAKNIGAEIRNNPKLVAIHEGYPATISEFILREKWHGSQDVSDLKSFVESKIAWLAAINLLLASFSLLALVAGFWLAIPVYLATMYLVCFVLSIYKFGPGNPLNMLVTPIFFFLYLSGRTLSIIARLPELKR